MVVLINKYLHFCLRWRYVAVLINNCLTIGEFLVFCKIRSFTTVYWIEPVAEKSSPMWLSLYYLMLGYCPGDRGTRQARKICQAGIATQKTVFLIYLDAFMLVETYPLLFSYALFRDYFSKWIYLKEAFNTLFIS